MINEWFLIINTYAGAGKARKYLTEIFRLIKDAGIHFTHRFTDYKGHGISLIQEAIKNGWRSIICVGGDGTINEAVNGIFSQNSVPTTDITLAMIPVGVGKDWGKTIGIPSNYIDAIRVIKQGITYIQDVGLVKYYNLDKPQKRYFVNIAGIGYDAFVTENANYMKRQGHSGTIPYLLSLLSCLIRYKYKMVKLKIDKHELEGKAFSINVGICKYSGGGMMQVPDAIPDDGFFDITFIKDVGKLDIIKNVNNLYDGTFIQHPKIETFRCRKISIHSHPKIFLEVDGESLGHSPLYFEIIPKSVKVVVEKHKRVWQSHISPSP